MGDDQGDRTCRLVHTDQTLEEILSDPAVRAALAKDGIDPGQLSDLLSTLRTRLLAQRWRSAA